MGCRWNSHTYCPTYAHFGLVTLLQELCLNGDTQIYSTITNSQLNPWGKKSVSGNHVRGNHIGVNLASGNHASGNHASGNLASGTTLEDTTFVETR